jgi:2-polyprenyl-3-methyl-5-hydroxy-6-metoxy-1,4-benzoquinol methylase
VNVETDETRFWNEWNAATRERHISAASVDQARVALEWLDELPPHPRTILDVGCGAGWMCAQLARFGTVTGTDLADEVLARAATRWPHIRFVPGDFMALPFPPAAFDVVVCFEVLAHVADQSAFVARLANLLVPGGLLVLSSQNPWVMLRSHVDPVGKGQTRRWLSAAELHQFLHQFFAVTTVRTLTPHGDRGLLRLVNSVKVNRVLTALMGENLVRRTKERLRLGRTIMVRAVRRAAR